MSRSGKQGAPAITVDFDDVRGLRVLVEYHACTLIVTCGHWTAFPPSLDIESTEYDAHGDQLLNLFVDGSNVYECETKNSNG